MKSYRFSLKTILLIIAFTVFLLYLALNLSSIWDGVQKVVRLFSPVTVGLCLAFVLNVPMRALENRVFAFLARSKRKFLRALVRPLSLILSLLLLLGIITLLIVFIIPDLREAITTLGMKLPVYFEQMKAWMYRTLNEWNIDSSWLSEFTVNWKLVSDTLLSFLKSDNASNMLGGAASWASSVAGGVVNVIFSLVIAVYYLLQKERIGNFVARLVRAFVPQKIADRLFYVTHLSGGIFSSFIRSQCIEAVILGSLTFVGMSLFRFEYAGIISMVIGFTALIPIIGALIGEIFGAFLLLTVDPIRAVVFLVFILVLQQLEGMLIYPKVVGDSVGLPGILVFSAVLIGGNMGGIAGALLAVPVCAVLFTLLKEAMSKRSAKSSSCSGEEEISEKAQPEP